MKPDASMAQKTLRRTSSWAEASDDDEDDGLPKPKTGHVETLKKDEEDEEDEDCGPGDWRVSNSTRPTSGALNGGHGRMSCTQFILRMILLLPVISFLYSRLRLLLSSPSSKSLLKGANK